VGVASGEGESVDIGEIGGMMVDRFDRVD
jgi:hypothetical protein